MKLLRECLWRASARCSSPAPEPRARARLPAGAGQLVAQVEVDAVADRGDLAALESAPVPQPGSWSWLQLAKRQSPRWRAKSGIARPDRPPGTVAGRILEAGRVDQRASCALSSQYQRCAGGVAAEFSGAVVENLRGRVRHQQIDQRALCRCPTAPAPAWRRSRSAAGALWPRRAGLPAPPRDRVTHRGVGRQCRRAHAAAPLQVGLVQQDVRRNAGARRRSARGELAPLKTGSAATITSSRSGGWRRSTWSSTRPGGKRLRRGSIASITPSWQRLSVTCQRTRSPTTQSLFLPRVLH